MWDVFNWYKFQTKIIQRNVFFYVLLNLNGKNNLCVHSQDAQIEKEKQVHNVTGGCTALTVVYLLGKLYVANAGDSRCVTFSLSV